MGRPKLTTPSTKTKLILTIDKIDKATLKAIAKSHHYRSISALNSAIAKGELIVLNLPQSILHQLTTIAHSHQFPKVEDFLIAIADQQIKFSIHQSLLPQPAPAPAAPEPIPRRKAKHTADYQITVWIDPTEQLTLRAIAQHHHCIVPSGTNYGDGSITILNRNIANGNFSLLNLNQSQLDGLWAIAQSQGFDSIELFLTSIADVYFRLLWWEN